MTGRAQRAAEAASRRRHPTALWLPDLDRMRRRLQARAVDRPAVPVTAEPYLEGDARA